MKGYRGLCEHRYSHNLFNLSQQMDSQRDACGSNTSENPLPLEGGQGG